VYVHVSDCAETVYELPLLPNNTAVKHFYTNQERCSALTGYLSLGRRSGGDWRMRNIGHSVLDFLLNRKKQQLTATFSSLLHSSRRPSLEI
jgi:hypothetical protein